MRISILISLIAFGLIAAALVDDDASAREDIVPGSRYVPASAAAMGDAYLPLATDPASALFYNPAGLGQLRGVRADIFNIELYGNTGYFSSIGTSNPDFYKVTSLNNYVSALQRSPGTNQGVGYSFAPAIYIKGFAFGLLAQEQVYARANSDGTINYRSNYQLIPTAGTALRLAEGIVRIGYSVQWVNQASGEVDNVPASQADGYNQGLSKGSAISHTLGIALTLPYQHLPQLDVVGRNLFTARFTGSAMMPFVATSVGTPANELTSFDASLSFVEKIGMGAEFKWVFEDRDFTDSSGVSILGRMAVGLEFDFRNSFFLRGGWGSGYPDAGIGLRRKSSELSISWASEEIGNSYHDQRDTRYILQYQVRAF